MKQLVILLVSVFYALAGFSQIPSYVPGDGLVAWYPFNGTADDESGNENHGTVYGAVLTTDRFGEDEAAYYFPGNNQQIIADNDTALTNHLHVTASAWFSVEHRPDGWQQNIILANLGPWNASGGFEFFPGNPPSTSITGVFRNTTYGDQELQTSGMMTIDSDTWYHVVYMLEYLAGTDETKASIYLNGEFIHAQNFASSISYDAVTPLIIGANIDSIDWQRCFKGKIDDVGLWNRVLTDEEIMDLYTGLVGIPQQEELASLEVYPNPAGDRIILKAEEALPGSHYTVTDLAGRVILRGKLDHRTVAVNSSSWAPGVYTITADRCDGPVRVVKK